MARNIVPRISGQETLGTQEKEFGKIYVKEIAGGSLAQIQALLAQYLPISGGVMSGAIIIGACPGMRKSGKSEELYFYGATTNKDGASFGFTTVNKSGQSHHLLGLGDGRLLWDNMNVGMGSVVAASMGASGYIKYASGLIIQWGHTANGMIVFPIAFTQGFSVTANSDYLGNNNLTCCPCDINGNPVPSNWRLDRVYIKQYGGNVGDFVFWQAIGV